MTLQIVGINKFFMNYSICFILHFTFMIKYEKILFLYIDEF